MTNVYDLANDLAQGLKNSDEFQNFKKAEAALKADEKHLKMARELMDHQQELQMKQMMGQITDDDMKAFGTLQQTVMGIPVIADYFQSQMYFAMILEEVMKTIGTAVPMEDIFSAVEVEEEPAPKEEASEEKASEEEAPKEEAKQDQAESKTEE